MRAVFPFLQVDKGMTQMINVYTDVNWIVGMTPGLLILPVEQMRVSSIVIMILMIITDR